MNSRVPGNAAIGHNPSQIRLSYRNDATQASTFSVQPRTERNRLGASEALIHHETWGYLVDLLSLITDFLLIHFSLL